VKQGLAVLALATATLTAGCFGNGSQPTDAGVGFETGATASLAIGTGSGSGSSEDFGSVQVGQQSAPASIVVTNSGAAASGALTAALMGGDAASFGIDADGCTGKTLAAGQTCTVAVHFLPATAGAKSASLTVDASPGGAATIALSGQGTVAGGLSITPATQSFGTVATGASSQATTFTVTSLAATAHLAMSFTGTDSADFKLGTDGCSGQSLAAGGTCSVAVLFSPSTAGSKTASLQASAGALAATSSLSGTAAGAATFLVTPATFDFGSLSEGLTSGAQAFAVKNTGGVASGSPTVAVTGANQGDFVVATNTCGSALAAGATCAFGVTFKPSTTGAESASIAVTATGTTGGSASVSGTGLAPAPIAFDPTTQGFGTEIAGQSSAEFPFVLTNGSAITTGPVAVTLTGTDASQFGITPGNCTVNGAGVTLAAGASCTLSVHFKPDGTVAAGPAQASLQATATPGGTTVATLTGTITTATALTIAPPSQGFGTVVQTQSTGDFPFVVTNGGGITSGAITVALGGANAAQFALGTDGCSTKTLAAGASCTVNVHFTPGAGVTGVQNATLSAGDSTTDTAVSTLTGTAATAASLSIAAPTGFTSFGPAANPTVTPNVAFTVTNSGGVTSGPLTVALGGANAGQFALGTDTCSGNTLAPGGAATCTVNVHFAPTAGTVGNEQATLTVTGTPGGSAPFSFVGIAAQPATLVIQPPTNFPGFGDVSLTQSSAASFTLKNTGGVVSGVPTIVSASKDFVVSAGTPACTAALAAGATCGFVLTFSPSSPATAESSVVTASAPSTVSGTYTATGTGAIPTLVISGPTAGFTGFGTVGVDQSATATFSLKNTGAVDTLAAPTITSSNTDYTISAATTTPCTAVLKAGASCNFVVTFKPAAVNASDSATLTASVTPGNSGTFPLTSVAAQATLAISAPAAWTGFGTVEVDSSASATFTVTNTGPVSTNAAPAVTSSNTDFVVSAGPIPCTSTLASNGTCNFVLKFTPHAVVTTDSATLTAAAAQAVSGSLTVSGSGAVPTLQVVPPSAGFEFGTVKEGQSVAATFEVKNTGPIASGMPTVTSSNGDFAVSAGSTNPCTAAGLAVNATCNFTVTFKPSSTGATESSVLTAADAPANPGTYTVTGQGGQAVLGFENGNLAPITSFGFGGVLVNTIAPVPPPGSITVYLANTGTVATGALQAMPALAAGYSVPSTTCTTGLVLAAGGKCSITIDFQNATPCASVATSLTMTDGTVSTPALSLSATGVTDVADYVLTANPASGAESLQPNQSAPVVYTMQNCGNVAGNTFVDLSNDCTSTIFTFAPSNLTCSTTAPLAELASCQFEVTVSGTTANTSKTPCFFVHFTSSAGASTMSLTPEPSITVQ
jgi:hypothetical protein